MDRLELARAVNGPAIELAAEIVASTVANGGVVHVFGSGHSQLLALEINERPSGLGPIQVIFDPLFGGAENLEGFGQVLLRDVVFRPPDCLIVVSNSGLTASPIELGLLAGSARIPVIALTSPRLSCGGEPRHPSGRRLFELADVVLDIGVGQGDACVRIEELAPDVGPTSTIVGAALLNAVVVESVARLVRRGIDPPLIRANSSEGGRAANAAMRARYAGRVRSVW